MKSVNSLLLVLLLPMVVMAQNSDTRSMGDTSNDEVVSHALDQVPESILAAARQAAPDVYFNAAISFWEDDFRVYRLTGRLYREVWHVYVRDDGRVILTESDTQDDR